MLVFVKVPLTKACVVPPAIPVRLPVVDGADQVYVVPAGTTPFVPFVGEEVKLAPLQIVAVIAVMVALGFRLIVSENTAPVQVPDNGVTR